MRPQIVKIVTLVLSFITSTAMLAQHTNAGSRPPAPNGQRGPQLPIDDHLFVLFIVALVYGCYIIYTKRKTKNSL
ncbi:MAG: hypothetical protein ACWA45_05655 [Flavobacteriales bacterium]